jgi:hypothetical protein
MFTKVDESELDNDIQNNGFMESFDIAATQNDWKQVKNYLELKDMSKSWMQSPDWIDKWDPLPDFLPFEDPSTPEGAFVRRWQKERDRLVYGGMDGNHSTSLHKSSSSRLDGPSYQIYCDENHDAFLDILTCVPWDDLMQDDEDGADISAIDQDVYLIEILS